MDDVFVEFSYRVDELQDYPNRDLIARLTQLALENVVIAEKLGNVVMSKLIHPQTLTTYKKPLYYVVDSILKKVGGPYPAYFQNALAEHFPKTVQEINEEDRHKLDFLFGTWEERQILSLDLLAKMRQLLKQQPSFSRQVQPQYQYQPVQNMQMGAVGGGGVGGAVPMMMNNPYQNSDIFKDLIANEMVSVLNSVLAEMRMTNPMTLEELSVMNPALFAQIRGKAEQNAITIMQRRMMQQQQQQPVQAQQNQYVSNSAASVNNVGYPTNNGRYLPPQQQQRAIPQQQQYQQEIASSQHYASHSQPQPRPHYNGGGRQGMNNKRSVAEVYAQPQAVEQYPPSLASNVPPVNQGNIMATQPVEFVNGFMCETPAIISVSRLQTLSQRLNNCTNDLLAQFSPRIGMMSGRLSQRLQDYVPVLMQPPPLPDILTDGRFFSNVNSAPQQPILQNTVATTSHVKASAAQGNNGMMRFQPPPPPRMSKPEFKLLDFDRQPELKSRALRNLYEGRPHQCFEDGLRFTNLQQLRQHTDGILERKKLMKKKSDRKEPQNREWFCTLPQWITNFQSKVLGATGADVTSSGQPGGSSSGATVASAVIAEAAEEFVIPADENFTRCPISGEVFQAIWDDEEGEMMYRNAVKVLLPPGSEPNLYHMARPVDGAGASTGIKYMIVHKLFVVDKWLQERKAMPLSDLPTEELLTQQLKEAAGEEDAEDIFVLLNQSLRF